jgi:hypothetical protein
MADVVTLKHVDLLFVDTLLAARLRLRGWLPPVCSAQPTMKCQPDTAANLLSLLGASVQLGYDGVGGLGTCHRPHASSSNQLFISEALKQRMYVKMPTHPQMQVHNVRDRVQNALCCEHSANPHTH